MEELRDLVLKEGIRLCDAIQIITSHVAKVLELWPFKGCIKVGSDADFVVLTPDIEIYQVWARGRMMVNEGEPLVFGIFE